MWNTVYGATCAVQRISYQNKILFSYTMSLYFTIYFNKKQLSDYICYHLNSRRRKKQTLWIIICMYKQRNHTQANTRVRIHRKRIPWAYAPLSVSHHFTCHPYYAKMGRAEMFQVEIFLNHQHRMKKVFYYLPAKEISLFLVIGTRNLR